MTLAACFEMQFRPDPELISSVRRFIHTTYERMAVDRDVVAQIALASHELLENATKYSTDGEATIRIEVRGAIEQPHVTIVTRNRVRSHDVERVATCLAELGRHESPLTYYVDLMRRARRSTQTGGLGLGRIAAEGDMALTMSHADEMLEIQAVHGGAAG